MVSAPTIGGALILGVGLAASAASSFFLADKETMRELVDQTPSSFDPRLLWGERGGRPVYMVAWSMVYIGTAISVLFLLGAGLFGDVEDDEAVFVSLVFLANCFLMSAAWIPVYELASLGDHDELNWVYIVSTTIIGLCAVFALVAAGFLRSFDCNPGFALLVGVPMGVTAGWLVVATGISVVQTVAVYDRRPERRKGEPEAGWAPLISALVSGVAAIAFSNPAVSVPSVGVVFFLRQHVLRWAALVVGVIFWLVSCSIVVLD